MDVWKSLGVGAAGYDILPFGNQTFFSRATRKQTIGPADIARDNGFSTWLDASLTPYLDAELGYTRSVHYDLNSVSFSLGLNVGHLLRKNPGQ